jgi:PAS domain S-box-containing protein
MKEQPKIMAVDDSSESLALLVKILTPAGYRVLPADGGELALAAAAADPPDLILLDIKMEGLDGLEVCRRLKADAVTRSIPVILISAFADVGDWVEGLRLGAEDYVSKPLQAEELLSRVKTHLALSRATLSLERQAAELRLSNEVLRCEIDTRRSAEEALKEEQGRLEQRIEERTRELRLANLRLEALWGLFSLDGIDDEALYEVVLRKLVLMTESECGFLGVTSEDGSAMRIAAWCGEGVEFPPVGGESGSVRIEEAGVWGEAVRRKEPLIINDYSSSGETGREIPPGHPPLFRLMAVPVQSEGRVVSLAVLANKGMAYEESDLRQVSAFLSGVKAILERRRALKAMRESERKYRIVADFTWDWETWRAPGGEYLYVSPSCERITGYAAAEFVADPALALRIAHPEDRAAVEEHFDLGGDGLDDGVDRHLDFRIVAKDGATRWISHFCRPILDAEGRILGRRASNRDITDRKADAARIASLLSEKELLLREVHHRIKNNMNSVASLLSIQSRMQGDQSSTAVLKDAERRLYSMGLLYDKLYRSENMREVSVKDYLPPLIAEIVATFPNAAIRGGR